MADRVEQREQLAGLPSLTQLREGQDGPHGGVAILPAIFTQPGDIL